MSAMGSLWPGYDPGYLLKETSKGAEGYYLSAVDEIGEPPGIWTGRACPGLGLEIGSEVEPYVMEQMYAHLVDPRDPLFFDKEMPPEEKARLGKAPRKYKTAEDWRAVLLEKEPDATPERIAEIEVEAREKVRQHAVLFFDYTFSPDKSISVFQGSLESTAVGAEREGDADDAARYMRLAGKVDAAIRAGNDAALAYLQDEAGYSRAGYHGKKPVDEHGRPLAGHGTGRWTDAHNWVIASFYQHTSRDGDPQLHIHNAILNRAENEDGEWRTLDSRALYRVHAGATAVGSRVMDEMIASDPELAGEFQQRPDGKARELTGVPQEVKDLFSSRRTAITAEVADLVRAYEERHGRPPSSRALFSMAQYATLHTRRNKPKKQHAPTRAEMLDGWAAQVTAAELGALSAIPGRVIGTQDTSAPGIEEMGAEEIDRVLYAAIAEVQAAHATWTRTQLLAAIDANLPAWLGGLDARMVRFVLDDLTGRALSGGYGIVSTEVRDLVPMPAKLTRSDGRSVFEPHDRALYSTASHIEAEEALAQAAADQEAGRAADPERIAAALGATPAQLDALPGRRPPATAAIVADEEEEEPGAILEFAGGLRADQAGAVWGIMTSTRRVDILVGPAGAGKSRTMGTLAALWPQHTGGNVTGVTTSENAAQVLAGEGVPEAYNIALYLAMHGRGQVALSPGDLLIVDEAGMVSTPDLTALHAIAAEAGAKILLTGDPAQLGAVGAGGALAMLARLEGHFELTEVARMRERWERAASLKIRAGDTSVLAEYDRHGRLAEGTEEQMTEAAYRGWLADHISGRDSLLIASTNDQAAELSARARAELVLLGQVEENGSFTLRDGNTAGRGDLVQARRNERRIKDPDGRWLVNRDILRIEAIRRDPENGEATAAVVRRDTGRDASGNRQWSAPFQVPAGYLAADAVLGYAGTVHAAQGRTVDTAHGVITSALDRALAYVMLTRGRLANYGYVVTERAAGAALQPERPLGQETPGQGRSADLRAGTRAAPALTEPGREVPEALRERARATAGARADKSAPWAPEADRFTVLAGVLEKDSTEKTALDTRRDEAERAGHMAHLGTIWADLAAEACAERYDAILARVLTPGQFERYRGEEARATLHRQVRAAELAGHQAEELLPRAVAIRPVEGDRYRGTSEQIAEVLHWRIEHECIGDPAPSAATFTERTPRTEDPEIRAVLLDLAERLDERTADLGARTALRPPPWALDRLGPVPEDQDERREWRRRAGAVAAYREQFGYTDPRTPIGREPAAPEARASWRAAAEALGRDAADVEVMSASEGDLWARRAKYERELAWAPPWVGEALRSTAHARREHETEAVLTEARAERATREDRPGAQARARAHRQLAAELRAREELLTEIDTQRARWHAETAEARDAADAATAELRRRRGDGRPVPPYRDPHRAAGPEPGRDAEPRETAGRDHLGDAAALRRAAEAAALARQVLDNREARRAADRERGQRERDDRAPGRRWPYIAPGRTPEQEREQDNDRLPRDVADIVAQSFPDLIRPGRPVPRVPDEPYRRPPEPPGRDGPTMGR